MRFFKRKPSVTYIVTGTTMFLGGYAYKAICKKCKAEAIISKEGSLLMGAHSHATD